MRRGVGLAHNSVVWGGGRDSPTWSGAVVSEDTMGDTMADMSDATVSVITDIDETVKLREEGYTGSVIRLEIQRPQPKPTSMYKYLSIAAKTLQDVFNNILALYMLLEIADCPLSLGFIPHLITHVLDTFGCSTHQVKTAFLSTTVLSNRFGPKWLTILCLLTALSGMGTLTPPERKVAAIALPVEILIVAFNVTRFYYYSTKGIPTSRRPWSVAWAAVGFILFVINTVVVPAF